MAARRRTGGSILNTDASIDGRTVGNNEDRIANEGLSRSSVPSHMLRVGLTVTGILQ